jgi:non-heme chloroperoxidase
MKKDWAHFFADFFKSFFGAGLVSSPVSKDLLEFLQS